MIRYGALEHSSITHTHVTYLLWWLTIIQYTLYTITAPKTHKNLGVSHKCAGEGDDYRGWDPIYTIILELAKSSMLSKQNI